MGIVIRSEWDVAKYLEICQLQRILPEFTLPSADFVRSKQNLPTRVRTFINFLVEHLAAKTSPWAEVPSWAKSVGRPLPTSMPCALNGGFGAVSCRSARSGRHELNAA